MTSETATETKPTSYIITTEQGYEITVNHLTEDDLRRSLGEFEAKYGMTSKEFVRRWSRGDLDCAVMDYFDWEFYCDGLARLYGEKDLEVPNQGEGELKLE